MKHSNNPLTIPTYGGRGVVHPSVIYFPKGFNGYKFWLYYTPYPPESAENPCLVRSNDGINFTDEGVLNPLLTPSKSGFDENYLADPEVIFVDGKFYMLYVGVNHAGISKVGLAESSDGVNFIKYDGNPILKPTQKWEAGTSILTPTVCYDGNKFHVLYETLKKGSLFEQRKIGYAFGNSLYELKKYEKNPVIEPNSQSLYQKIRRLILLNNISRLLCLSSPHFRSLYCHFVVRHTPWDAEAMNHLKLVWDGRQYYLFYVGRDKPWWLNSRCRLGLAISKDVKTWKKYHKPILSPTRGWESHHIYRASPVIVDGKIYLYYSAFSENWTPRIGLAILENILLKVILY